MRKKKEPSPLAVLINIESQKQDRLLRLIAKYPGLDAIALKGKGFHPASHGSLVDAENGGWIVYHNGGWYLPCDVPGKVREVR